MRGNITKRSDDSYRLAISLGKDPETGQYKQYFETVKGNKKDADKRLAELLHEYDTGCFMKPGKTTLAEYLDRWLRDYVRANLAPRTAEGYESIVRRHLRYHQKVWK